ncbi:MAG TPA: hypothetical protein VHH52_10455, partial [Pseudonocardiaceae bacterium]|nr:hypothetical protein [Pseudonocardiaceae bacterium]
VCGITPYDVTHLGHASTFVWADAAAAVLRLAGHARMLAARVERDGVDAVSSGDLRPRLLPTAFD